MKKIAVLILSIGLFIQAFSQTRITVRSANEADFLLFVNDVQVNSMGVISVTVDNIMTPKTTLKAVFPAQPDRTFSQPLVLKKNTSVFYDIEEVKGAYKFVLKSESSVVINTAKNDVVQVSSNTENPSVAIELDNEPELENQQCPKAATDGELLTLSSELMEVRFEGQKVSKMKTFVNNKCISVEQLEVLLLTLSMEDSKMDLLEHAISRIYDPSNLKGIENNFFLEKNKRKVIELIK